MHEMDDMQLDIFKKGRKANRLFSISSLSTYLSEYTMALHEAIKLVDPVSLEKFAEMVVNTAKNEAQVLVIGNGGSAAIADHLCCDFAKGTLVPNAPKIRPISLASNLSLYSAAANDFGFENAFASQIEIFARPNDLVIAISSSGESPNIVNGIKTAQKLGLKVIGLTGFDGGEVKRRSDVSIHVGIANYGIIEDCHQVIMHSVAQIIAARREKI